MRKWWEKCRESFETGIRVHERWCMIKWEVRLRSLSNVEPERFSEQGLAWFYWCFRKATQAGRLHRRWVCGPVNRFIGLLSGFQVIMDVLNSKPLNEERNCHCCHVCVYVSIFRTTAIFELYTFRSFIHLRNIYYLSTYYVPGAIVPWRTSNEQNKNSCLHGPYFLCLYALVKMWGNMPVTHSFRFVMNIYFMLRCESDPIWSSGGADLALNS